jgi:thiamine biosynthesis lipoprotein ApbE
MASVTVIAASAMVADALATAAFALGADEGRAFLEVQGVDGLLVSSSLDRTETSGFSAHTIR